MIDTAIIIATGSSAHTSQLTYNRPLTMLPALGKPLCVRVMDRLYRTGIKKYVVVLGEQEGAVANYLNTRWIPGTEIEYVLKPGAMALGKVLSSIALNHNRPMMFANYNSFTHEKFPARLRKYHEFSPDDLILTGAASSLSTSSTQTFAQLKLPDNGNLTRKTSPRQAARR
ncbi:MAG: sugar phosphate nucleotidyltransferase, partial [Chloroflexota bacterium]